MEADWSAEVGAGLPEIAWPWAGFRNLSGLAAVEVAGLIGEAATVPALSETLALLNGAGAPVRTSKCDVWALGADEIDIYEFDTSEEECRPGLAAYVDVVVRDPVVFSSYALTEVWARALVRGLAQVTVPHARAEVVIRAAEVRASAGTGIAAGLSGVAGFGLTLYAFGCGRDVEAADRAWSAALRATAAATIATVPQAAGE